MSYALIVAEVRRGNFEERNLDSLGLAALMGIPVTLLAPRGDVSAMAGFADRIVASDLEETAFLNPMNMAQTVGAVMEKYGKPQSIIFTHSSSGTESAAYVAGALGLPIVTDVSAFEKDGPLFHKSYYSDKIFGQFRAVAGNPPVLTVRSGSFKESAVQKGLNPPVEPLEGIAPTEARLFVEYVEEEKTDIDITKAEFLLSVGRGVGNKDEIPSYEELASLLKAILSGSRPVIDKTWLPKARQVGTSGKTVKPKVYLALGISGAFQHIAGMKDSDCIIAVNKDPEAPIFQYAHYGLVGDMHKVRDKLKDLLKG